MVVRERHADTVEKISASTSYGGNPMACAAALASIEVIEEENLLAHAAMLGDLMLARMQEMKARHPIIGDVRGKGLSARHRAGQGPRHQGTLRRSRQAGLPEGLPQGPGLDSRRPHPAHVAPHHHAARTRPQGPGDHRGIHRRGGERTQLRLMSPRCFGSSTAEAPPGRGATGCALDVVNRVPTDHRPALGPARHRVVGQSMCEGAQAVVVTGWCGLGATLRVCGVSSCRGSAGTEARIGSGRRCAEGVFLSFCAGGWKNPHKRVIIGAIRRGARARSADRCLHGHHSRQHVSRYPQSWRLECMLTTWT